MRGSTMSLTASGFVVIFLSLSAVLGESDWGVTYSPSEICAVKGSTVDINCTSRYPATSHGRTSKVLQRTWYIEVSKKAPVVMTTHPDYMHRVEYHYNDKNCSFTIRDLKQSDSAVYRIGIKANNNQFTGLPGVHLSVSDLQVQVMESESQQKFIRAVLRCQSLCPDHTDYVWFRNKQVITRESSSSPYVASVYPSDMYSCAVRGYEMFPSPPVYAPKLPSVSVSPSGEIMEGRSVTLTCNTDAHPAATYTWYKKQHPRIISSGPQFTFSSIQSSDSGEYYCRAENKLGTKSSEYQRLDVKWNSEKMVNIVRLSLVVLLLIPLIFLSLWTRKKKLQRRQTDQSEGVEMRELDSHRIYENVPDLKAVTAAQRDEAEDEDLRVGASCMEEES